MSKKAMSKTLYKKLNILIAYQVTVTGSYTFFHPQVLMLPRIINECGLKNFFKLPLDKETELVGHIYVSGKNNLSIHLVILNKHS